MKEIESMIYIFTNTVSEPAKVAIETAHTFDWTMFIQPTATLITGILAIIAVVWSQRKLDDRQRKDHQLSTEMKSNELIFVKKEELVTNIIKLRLAIIASASIYFNHKDEEIILGPGTNQKHVDDIREIVDIRTQCLLLVKLYFIHLSEHFDAIESTSTDLAKFHQSLLGKPISRSLSDENKRLMNECNKFCNKLMQQIINDDHNNMDLFKRS